MTAQRDLPTAIGGLAAIAGRYDAVILDLWGCVHDGIRPYPGVADVLARLRAHGTVICLLSNAPRRCASVAAKLAGMGIGADAYDHLVTSGEATHLALAQPPDAYFAGLGQACYHLGPARDADIFDGLPAIRRVAEPAEAEFVVNTGIDDFAETVADYEAVLVACAERQLPMVCANPDLIVTVGDRLAICAGMLAQRYEDLGGVVRQIGKPHPEVYRLCQLLIGDIAPDRVLAVGDSLLTDIAGAARAGFDSLFLSGGIHQAELAGDTDHAALRRLLATAQARPTWITDQLRW